MAIRNFDGAANRIGMGSTGLQVANGAFSIVGVVRPTSLTTGEGFLGLRSSGVMVASLADGGSGKLALYTDTLEASAIVGLTAGDHQIIALTKAAGAVAVRFHRKAVGTGSWTHTSSGSTHPDVAGVVDEVVLGGFNPANTSGVKDFDGAVFALFSGLELVDSDIEAIQTFATSQFLYDLGATNLWNLNQASVATSVVDQIGDADQNTITGTTVVTGSDPAWNFSISVPPKLVFTVRLSGGAGNTNPAASIGGAISSTSAGANIWDNVTNPERTAGLVDYRLLYVKNDDTSDANVTAYLPITAETGRAWAIGLATQAVGVTVPAISNDTTAPSGVSFSSPSNAGSGLTFVVPAGSYRGLWFRRTTSSGAPVDPTNFGKIRLELSRTS
jgi:hypothetical protein